MTRSETLVSPAMQPHRKIFLLRVAALGVSQRAQIAENPLLGVFPDGAGVHDDHIRAPGAADDGIAALGEEAPQLFGIGLFCWQP